MPSSPRSRRFLRGFCCSSNGLLLSVDLAFLLIITQDVPRRPSPLGGVVFEAGDEIGELLLGDAAELADFDAAELAGSEEVVDLVAADVEHLGYLLDGVCLHGWSPPLVATVCSCLRVCLRSRLCALTCRRARRR